MTGSAQTDVDVLNLALGLLGENPVNSFDPDGATIPETEAGEKMARFYKESRDEVQSSYYWQELVTTSTLSVASTSQDDLGRYLYDLPTDTLRPIGVLDGSTTAQSSTIYSIFQPQDSNVRYFIRGNQVVTYGSGADIFLTYIKREADPSQWSAELLRSIYYNLAAVSAQAVTQNVDIARNVLEKYEVLVRPFAQMLQTKYKTNEPMMPSRTGMIMDESSPPSRGRAPDGRR